MFISPSKDKSLIGDHSILNELDSAANQVGKTVRNAYDSASDEVSDFGNSVTDQIRSNPIRSSAIALGLGMVLGALIRR